VIGKANIAIPAGKKRPLALKLNPKGKALLARRPLSRA
jgi:hypothetical protein